MLPLILSLALLGLLVLGIAAVQSRRAAKRGSAGSEADNGLTARAPQREGECCGQHEVCEKESLLAAVSRDVEYYDDEELDRYRRRRPETYTDDETEEFRTILYTMQETEVAGWVRSLELRDIALPDGLRDEVLLIIGERRTQ